VNRGRGATYESRRRKTDRLYELDGLRLAAALFVVLFHYTFSGPVGGTTSTKYPEISGLTQYGYLGVDLFFLISGFVVLMSSWGRTPRAFAVSRLARLYPAYWLAVALTALVTVTLGRDMFEVSPFQVLVNLTMFQSVIDVPNVDVVYWTLWAEMRFYFLILAFAWLGMTRGRVMVLLWGWLAMTALVQLGLLPGVADLVVQSEFSHYFIAGMALYVVYRFGVSRQPVLIVALCLANAINRGIGYANAVGRRYGVEYEPWIISLVIVAAFVIMALVAVRALQPLARPWLVTAGALTYPLYLLHAHIGFIVYERTGASVNRWVLLVVLVAVMCLAAHAVHRWVERPVAPLLRRLSGPRTPPGATGSRPPAPVPPRGVAGTY
jgi:peptidoglycan/LPS O-acetylase OafA/YrhL